MKYGDELLKVIKSREEVLAKYDKPLADLLKQEYELRDKRDHLFDQLTDTENELIIVRVKIGKFFRELGEDKHE